MSAAIPARHSTAAVPVASPKAAAPKITRTIEIGEIVVELGVAEPSSWQPWSEQTQTGSLIASIPSLRMAGGRR
jgi:hypothetical protein